MYNPNVLGVEFQCPHMLSVLSNDDVDILPILVYKWNVDFSLPWDFPRKAPAKNFHLNQWVVHRRRMYVFVCTLDHCSINRPQNINKIYEVEYHPNVFCHYCQQQNKTSFQQCSTLPKRDLRLYEWHYVCRHLFVNMVNDIYTCKI